MEEKRLFWFLIYFSFSFDVFFFSGSFVRYLGERKAASSGPRYGSQVTEFLAKDSLILSHEKHESPAGNQLLILMSNIEILMEL